MAEKQQIPKSTPRKAEPSKKMEAPPLTGPSAVSDAQWDTLKQGCMVAPGYFRLRQWATAPDTFPSKEEMTDKLNQLSVRMDQLLTCMHAQKKQRLLIILQGMDAAGKDGVARKLIAGQHPMAIRMVTFNVPTRLEDSHDFLWRVHPYVPGDGECVIFDRSHYDALIMPMANEQPSERWIEARVKHINDFERMLTDNGTHILKIFLHMSRSTQHERFVARWNDPVKRWKLTAADLHAGEHYSVHAHVIEQVIDRTHTDNAPWWVLPADVKGFRNLIAAELFVGVLERMGLQWPPADPAVAASGFWKTSVQG